MPLHAIAASPVIFGVDQNNVRLSGYPCIGFCRDLQVGYGKPHLRREWSGTAEMCCAGTWVILSYLQPATIMDKVQHF